MPDHLTTVQVGVHLAGGKELQVEFDVDAGADDDELLEAIKNKLAELDEKGRSTWVILGDTVVHSAAVQAVQPL